MTRVLEVKSAESARVFGGSERSGVGRRRSRRTADRPRPASSIRARPARPRLLYIFFAFGYLLSKDPPLPPPRRSLLHRGPRACPALAAVVASIPVDGETVGSDGTTFESELLRRKKGRSQD